MPQRLASSDLSVEELLSGRFAFSIPAFQRDYAWTKEEALQLVDDVVAAMDDIERDGAALPYFLGTMLVVAPPAERRADANQALEPVAVDVVDGQQRLITLVILFAVLRDLEQGEAAAALDRLLLVRGPAGERRYLLELRSADNTFFCDAIEQPGATRHSPADRATEPALSRPTRVNIDTVRAALRQRFQRQFTPKRRAELAQFLRQNARVLLVVTGNLDYAFQIFLSINDRGKRLTVEDIFRGEILGPLEADQRTRYESIIEEMNKYMEAGEQARSKGKTFFSHLASIQGWARGKLIDGLKAAVQKQGGARRFAAEVFAPMAEVYLQAKGSPSAATPPSEVEERLELLRWLERHGDDDWMPAAMHCVSRLSGETAELARYLAALDRFAHALMILGCGRDARRRHYAPVLRRLADTAPLPDPVQTFPISGEDQRIVLRRIATRMHVEDPAAAKLILVRADQAASGRPVHFYRPLLEHGSKSPERFTVEHVCPRGAVAGGEWATQFPSPLRRKAAAECIGNLVLISEAQNKRANQGEFAAKKRVYFREPAPSPFLLTEMLRDVETWDAAAIEQRYSLVMRTLKTMWSLDGTIPSCPATRAGASGKK